MAPGLLAQARAQATAERLVIQWDEGLAAQLPYSDAAFDAVVSMFGIMFSPLPERAAAEAARVLRPGGRLFLASWMADGFSGKVRSAIAPYLPPPAPDAPSPEAWGDDGRVRVLLDPGFTGIETDPRPARWDMAMPPREAATFFIQSSGHLQLMLPRLDSARAGSLHGRRGSFCGREPRRASRRGDGDRELLSARGGDATGDRVTGSRLSRRHGRRRPATGLGRCQNEGLGRTSWRRQGFAWQKEGIRFP